MNTTRLTGLAGALAVCAAFVAIGDVVWHETFDDPSSVTNWHCESGFSVRMGEGVDGSGALVWEESEKRPLPPGEAKPIVQEEDNVLRTMPQDGRKICRRRISVEPGRRYTASVRLKGAVTNNCGYLFLALYGTDGKPMGRAAYAKPEIWKEVGTKGWQTLSVSTQRLPQDALCAETYVEFYRTTLGKMAFDDFTVSCTEQRLVELMFSSAYRDEQAVGEVRFVAPYVMANGMEPDRVAGRFVFKGPDGEFSLPAKKEREKGARFETSLDVARLVEGKSEVKVEFLYDGEVRDACTLTFDHPKTLSTRKVRIDGKGMTYVNGKPFFPLGIYVHPRDYKLKNFKRIAGGPFNCIIECAARESILNRLHKAGMMAIVKSPRSEDLMRRAYGLLKDHPALLGWYVIDEAFPGRALVEIPLQKIRREIDPDHPTLAVLNIAENTGPLMGCFDVVARDPYPLSHNCKFPPGCDRQDLLDVAFWPALMREYGYGLPPVWQVPQAFSWGWLRTNGTPDLDRFPTEVELRSMAWQSIAGGANGVLWFSSSAIFGRAEKNPEEGEKCWDMLVKVATEINGKMPWFLSEETAPRTTACPATMAARAFRKDGKVAVLVTNRTAKPASGEVRLEDGTAFSVELPLYGVVWR